jgi:HK97 family phage major capsid protein
VKSIYLKQKKESLQAERDLLANKSELNAEEKTRWTELTDTVSGLDNEIKIEEEKESFSRQRAAEHGSEVSKNEEKDIQKYSIVKAIRESMSGKLTGLEAEMNEEAQKENRNFGGVSLLGISQKVLMNKTITRATIAATSGPTVPTVIGNFIDAVYARLVLVALGAKTMSGLQGNVALPYWSTAPTMKWDAENDAASDATGVLNKITLSPKRITNYIPLSKQLLIQDAVGIEQKIWDTLIAATAVKLENGCIQGGSDAPTGILATSGIGDVAGGTNGVAPTLANMLALQKEVAIDNAMFGSLAYLASPKGRWKLQSTAIESGHPERVWNILQPEVLLGYKAGITSNVPDNLDKGTSTGVCSAIIFGNFEKLTIAQFGALDLTVDPYTDSKSAIVNMVVNAYYDSAVELPIAFAAMKDALCAS